MTVIRIQGELLLFIFAISSLVWLFLAMGYSLSNKGSRNMYVENFLWVSTSIIAVLSISLVCVVKTFPEKDVVYKTSEYKVTKYTDEAAWYKNKKVEFSKNNVGVFKSESGYDYVIVDVESKIISWFCFDLIVDRDTTYRVCLREYEND